MKMFTNAPSRTHTALAAAAFSLAAVGAVQAQWTATILTPSSANNGEAWCVQGDQQVGRVSSSQAILWNSTASSWISLHPASASQSRAYSLDDGQQCGSAVIGGNQHASLWSGSAESWLDLHPAGMLTSAARYMADGQQVGWAENASKTRYASLWSGTSGSWVNLNPAGATTSNAYAVDNGVQVGYATISGRQRAGMWTGSAGSWVDLSPPGTPGSYGSLALGVRDGWQIGGLNQANGTGHAVMWNGSAASMIDLHPAEASNTYGYDTQDGRQVGVIYLLSDPARARAAYWNDRTPESWEDLTAVLPGEWDQSFAVSIWNDETTIYVAGYGYDLAARRNEAILWTRPIVASCEADCDESNSLDFFDILCFLNDLSASNPAADCDDSTSLDFFDVLCFLNLFNEGCD